MTPAFEIDAARARAYLLRSAGEQVAEAIEQEYVRSPDALEVVEAAEESLIEDYLADRLPAAERVDFERYYLAVPRHRTRVETIRRLTRAASSSQTSGAAPAVRRRFDLRPFAIAAALVLVAGASIWLATYVFRVRPIPAPELPKPVPSRVVFAWNVSPTTVRSAGDTAALVIPAATDTVRLQFEGEVNAQPITRGRAAIRVVGGDEIWQGPVIDLPNRPAGVIAVTDVPSARLKPGDYTITLFETAASGGETERARYFLRVRTR